jgi:hypothetical protein
MMIKLFRIVSDLMIETDALDRDGNKVKVKRVTNSPWYMDSDRPGSSRADIQLSLEKRNANEPENNYYIEDKEIDDSEPIPGGWQD